MMVCDEPSVIVEVTFLTPEMLATASSTRLVTCVSSSLGATPGSVTVTETIGTSMLGKRVTGSFEKLISAERHQDDEHQDRRNRVADRPCGKIPAHQRIAPVCSPRTGVTMSPSATKVPARETTSSPSAMPETTST